MLTGIPRGQTIQPSAVSRRETLVQPILKTKPIRRQIAVGTVVPSSNGRYDWTESPNECVPSATRAIPRALRTARLCVTPSYLHACHPVSTALWAYSSWRPLVPRWSQLCGWIRQRFQNLWSTTRYEYWLLCCLSVALQCSSLNTGECKTLGLAKLASSQLVSPSGG